MSPNDVSNERARQAVRRAILIGLGLVAVLAAGAAGHWLGRGSLADAPWSTPARGANLDHRAAEPPAVADAASGGQAAKRVLYYRNPMGLPDTSPTPKKDWMGMDYIAVYEGEAQDDGSTVRISADRVQRSGVRTAKVERRALVAPVRVPGTVKIDERRVKVVTLRFDGFIEDLFVNATGQAVRAGQPLFRVYSSQVQQAQVDLIVAAREHKARAGSGNPDSMIDGPMQRLRNLGVPEARIREVRETGNNPRTIDWPSPMNGVVLEKKVIDGQRATMGSELYRIADLSTVWVIAEVPEQALPQLRIGDRATARFLALPGEEREGGVTFIYPDLKPETRTARVRIELPNPDLKLKTDMYADVTIGTGDGGAVLVVPDGAAIDSGNRQAVIVAKGEGRFEPRLVKLGRRGEGMVEVREGLSVGDEVVTTATFLIDAESNLKAALQAFTAPESPK